MLRVRASVTVLTHPCMRLSAVVFRLMSLALHLHIPGMSYYWTNLGMTNREAVVLNGGGHSMGG